MPQNANAFASLFGLGGAVLGFFIPFWLGWASIEQGANLADQATGVTTGLVGPILIGLTGAIILGILGMVLGMVVDGYVKKEY